MRSKKKIREKIKLIIFEGSSGTGKSTLSRVFAKIINYRALIVDRFLPSYFVFDLLFDRRSSFSSIKTITAAETALKNAFDVYLIYLFDDNISQHFERIQRSESCNWRLADRLMGGDVHTFYERYFSMSKFKTLKLNNDNPIESIGKIAQFCMIDLPNDYKKTAEKLFLEMGVKCSLKN